MGSREQKHLALVANGERCCTYYFLKSAWPSRPGSFIFGFAGSHGDGWHFRLLGTTSTLLWPLSLSLSLHRSCSSSLGLLLLLPPSFLKIAAPASNLRLPLSWSLSRQAHFLCTLLIAASLSSDSASLRLFPSLRASSSFFLLFLPPASQPLSLHSARLSSSFYISNSSSFRTPLQFNSP